MMIDGDQLTVNFQCPNLGAGRRAMDRRRPVKRRAMDRRPRGRRLKLPLNQPSH